MTEVWRFGDFENPSTALSEKDLMFKSTFEELKPFNQPTEFGRPKETAVFFMFGSDQQVSSELRRIQAHCGGAEAAGAALCEGSDYREPGDDRRLVYP